MQLLWIPILLIWGFTLPARADEAGGNEVGDDLNNIGGSNEDEGNANTELESVEIQTRQDLGYYKCLSNGACASVCSRNFYCDFNKGICMCGSGASSTAKCDVAPKDSICARQYVDCVSQKGSFAQGQAVRYLCSGDDKQTEKMCVLDGKLGYQRCRNNQVCQVLCKGGYGQCDYYKGMCTCSIGLGTAVEGKCTEVKAGSGPYRRCYEYAGRYSTKYICNIENQNICVHALYKPDKCRPVYEVCEANGDCCQGTCDTKRKVCVKGDATPPITDE